MLYYDRIDISDWIDWKVTTGKNLCFVTIGFFYHGCEFQDTACNGCHDLMMLNVNICDITIVTVKDIDYRCAIHEISKYESIQLLENSILDDCGHI